MRTLQTYDISEQRGFLCKFDAGDIALTGELDTLRDVALSLPDLLPSGRVRSLLRDRLPDIDMPGVLQRASDAELRMAMVHCSFLVQAYVWGEAAAPDTLPRCLAVPIVALADHLGQQPLLPYSGYVLDNWAEIERGKGITLENTRMLQHFLGGQDETWFVLIHVAIEAQAGPALVRMPQIVEAVAQGDDTALRKLLEEVAEVWEGINAIFDKMPERCDPYIYFARVRPYIHGWKDNPALPDGLRYDGIARFGGKGQAFRGQTGSQSSIVPAMDALLGVGHAHDPMKAYLDELHIYRPPPHRQFIEDLRAESGVRDFVARLDHRGLTAAYNANVQAVADFRSRHLEYAASYIHRQSRAATGNDTDVGTGGTPFMRYLKKHRDETRARLLPVAAKQHA
ncbi:MAG: indoleamine 2,3-dioxygenase [Pseudomonadota bacterium]